MASEMPHAEDEKLLAKYRRRPTWVAVALTWLSGLAAIAVAWLGTSLPALMICAFVLFAGATVTGLWLRYPTHAATRHAAAIFLAVISVLISTGVNDAPFLIFPQADGLLLALALAVAIAFLADWLVLASYGSAIAVIAVLGLLTQGGALPASSPLQGSVLGVLAVFVGGMAAVALGASSLRKTLIEAATAEVAAADAASAREHDRISGDADRQEAWNAGFAAAETAIAANLVTQQKQAEALVAENASLRARIHEGEAARLAQPEPEASFDMRHGERTQTSAEDIARVAETAGGFAAALGEILERIAKMRQGTEGAALDAQSAQERVTRLAGSSEKIGEVLTLIRQVADKTNLLALNATIEAARAGEAGRGFAVVAGEVKGLAGQTARATEHIAAQIEALRADTGQSTQALNKIAATIGLLDRDAMALVSELGSKAAEIGKLAERLHRIAAVKEK